MYNPNIRPTILNETESRNIDMPSNRELVRAQFLKTIAEEIARNEDIHTGELEKKKETIENDKKTKNTAKEEKENAQLNTAKSISKIRSTFIIQSQAEIVNEEEEEEQFKEVFSFAERKEVGQSKNK